MGYDKNIFAHNLQLLMREYNQKQADIAKVLGVSKATMSDYCNGKQMPRMDKLQQLADYFHTRVSSLIEEPLENQKNWMIANRVLPEDLQFALFGGAEGMDEDDVKAVLEYAEFIKNKKLGKL